MLLLLHVSQNLSLISDVTKLNNMVLAANRTGIILLGGGLAKHHVCNANSWVRIWIVREMGFLLVLFLLHLLQSWLTVGHNDAIFGIVGLFPVNIEISLICTLINTMPFYYFKKKNFTKGKVLKKRIKKVFITMFLCRRGMEQTLLYTLTQPRNLMVVTREPVQMKRSPGEKSIKRQNMWRCSTKLPIVIEICLPPRF